MTRNVCVRQDLFYILGGLIITVLNVTLVPQAFSIIFEAAFNTDAAPGGTIDLAIRYGIA